MYKMKEVCQMTGLTEKAIRIYMDQKLVEPEVEEGIHRKSYFFREKDVERLKDISALRSAGFSMAEIKQMLESPEKISLLVEEKKELLEGEILQKIAIQETLNYLTIEEHSDVTKLVDAIEPRSTYAKETPKKKMQRRKKWMILLIIVLVWLSVVGAVSGMVGVLIPVLSFGLVFGIIALISGLRFLLYSRQADKRKGRGLGKITAVVENEKVEEYIGERERSTFKDIMAYFAFGMFGEGVWNMLRPDCWYPVISYHTEDGDAHTATTRYGGFKSSWQIGEELTITWEDGKERLVHTCDGVIFCKKAWFYLILGVILLVIFGVGVAQLVNIKNNGFEIAADSDAQKLEFPVNADRVVMESNQKRYELNEEELEVLKNVFQEAEIGAGKEYYSINAQGVVTIYFYQGEEEIEKYIANLNYILTRDYMLYLVMPNHMEFRGVDIGDTDYIAGCLNHLEAKVRERYAVEEIGKSITGIHNLKDLKNMLEVTENFQGAYDISDGYKFLFSERGYIEYFGKQPKENETGKIEVTLRDGTFVSAVLTSYYYTEEGDIETYRKEW